MGSLGGLQPICGIAQGGTGACADSATGDASSPLVQNLAACLPKDRLLDIALDRRGAKHWLAVATEGGQAKVFGSLICGSGSVPSGVNSVKRIVVADAHACALSSQGQAYCWNADDPSTLEPVLQDNFVDIAAGTLEACGVNASGKVRCWDSQGNEDVNTSYFASQISGAPNSRPVVQLASAADGHNLCALFDDGIVLCSQSFNMGLASFQLPEGERVVEIAVGSGHVCGIRPDDSVLCLPLGCSGCSTTIAPPSGFKAAPR
jgi:hypothetical protein